MHSADLIAIAISCLTVIGLGLLHYRKRARVELNDYVAVLDFEEWRSRDHIHDLMEEQHHGWLDAYEVIRSLIELEKEGRIIHRAIPHVTPYGVTEIHQFKRSNGEGGMGTYPAIIPFPPTHGLKLVTITNKTPHFGAGFFDSAEFTQ
ncbi:MAG TPA: hypothetical protein VL335_01350 [Candidatus Paceibacterota bacterium]|jgi:hypothetical protein|nr:hypothetical protein [Candidatus Paceibacterota bacterium]